MDKGYIEKHDIAQRYLHSKLSPEEAQEFEIYLMDNPDMVDALEVDHVFKSELELSAVEDKKPNAIKRLLSQFKAPMLGWGIGGLAAFSTLLLVNIQLLSTNHTSDLGNIKIEYISQQRSVNASKQDAEIQRVKIPAQLDTLIIVLPAIDQISQSYQVVIRKTGSEDSFEKKDIFLSSETGDVAVPINGDELMPGVITIELVPESKPNQKQQFSVALIL